MGGAVDILFVLEIFLLLYVKFSVLKTNCYSCERVKSRKLPPTHIFMCTDSFQSEQPSSNLVMWENVIQPVNNSEE